MAGGKGVVVRDGSTNTVIAVDAFRLSGIAFPALPWAAERKPTKGRLASESAGVMSAVDRDMALFKARGADRLEELVGDTGRATDVICVE